MDAYSKSEAFLNEQTNLSYTDYYSPHVDGTADRALRQSEENLRDSEILLRDSEKKLREARAALANLEIQNLMTKLAHYLGAQKYRQAYTLLCASRDDVGLTRKGRSFHGRAAVLSLVETLEQRQRKKLEELKASGMDVAVDETMYGGGFEDNFLLCSPYLVIAADGKTAQGVWRLQRITKETAAGQDKPRSGCTYEQWHVDFLLESDCWKLWHLYTTELFAEHFDESELPPGPMELRIPRVGGNSPPGNLAMGGMMGMPGMPGGGGVGIAAPKAPVYPEPYETFEEEMLLREHTARTLDYVGLVPEYMMHLPFVFQPDGPPGMGPEEQETNADRKKGGNA